MTESKVRDLEVEIEFYRKMLDRRKPDDASYKAISNILKNLEEELIEAKEEIESSKRLD